ncbi:MAG TPA: exodeoxyribonuclease VII small subunit [Gammaproteobacteria bacterium]|nr:exodeoxyribonuclease VII small subunit [Gammaproteobacteria bacterium]
MPTPRHPQAAKPVSKDETDDISFEEALAELESLVERMESGELSLEESLASFEKGVALTRRCQAALDQAEQKVKVLTANTPEADTEPFESDL